jgi:hypothetical protein
MAEIPKEGFLKIVAPGRTVIDPAKKAALIRRGNQLFNDGDIATAKKIFLTLGYTDGIIRTGDYHYKNADYWEAYRLYSLAPAPERLEHMVNRMADVIREWISE